MPTLIVHHQVADYQAWEPIFLDGEATRKQHGIQRHQIFRGLQDPNAVSLIFEIDDPSGMAALMADPEVQQAMAKSGVIGQPTVHVVKTVGEKVY